MGLLSGLLDVGYRQPASCAITVGTEGLDLGALAPLASLVEISLSRTEAATGKLVFEDRRLEGGQWMVADSGLFERWAPIKVSAVFGDPEEEVFRGYVVAMNPAMPLSGGDATLELQVQDEGAALDREQMQKTWGDPAPETDLQILTQLVQPLNLAVDPESAAGASSRSLAQNATPIQFLRERAKANGYELIFAEGKVYFGPMRLSGTAQAPILLYAGRATNCLSFNVTDEAQKPDAVAFATAPRDSGATPVDETVQPDVTALGSTPAAAEGAGLGTPSVWRVTKEKDETEEEVRARAQSLANDNSFKLRATGELDGSLYGHVLRPGRTVTVDGAGDRYGGTYYVDRVTHVFTPEGYRQNFELIRNATGEDGGAGSGPLGAASALASLF